LRVYYVHAAASAYAFAVFATLSSIYRIRDVGLGPFELVLVGTVLEATVLLTELPTGVVADTISRRLSVLVGTVLIGLGFMLEGLVPVFASVLAAQMVWGLGASFESGALEAWLSDEIGEARANVAFLRAAQLRQAGLLLGIPFAAWLGSVTLGFPLIFGGAVFLVLAAYLALAMRERSFAPAEAAHRNPVRSMRATLVRAASAARRRPLIGTILIVAVFVGASSETFDRLWEARLLAGPGLPAGVAAPLAFGVLAAVTAVLGIGVAELAHRALRRNDARGGGRRILVAWLAAAMAVQALAVAAFGLAGRLDLAVATYLAARVAGRLHVPLYTAWLNRELEPSTRATAFSSAGAAVGASRGPSRADVVAGVPGRRLNGGKASLTAESRRPRRAGRTVHAVPTDPPVARVRGRIRP